MANPIATAETIIFLIFGCSPATGVSWAAPCARCEGEGTQPEIHRRIIASPDVWRDWESRTYTSNDQGLAATVVGSSKHSQASPRHVLGHGVRIPIRLGALPALRINLSLLIIIISLTCLFNHLLISLLFVSSPALLRTIS